MMGPPFLKLSTKKFLSNAPSGAGVGVGDVAGAGEVPAVVVVVVVAGDIALVAGVVPAMGEIPGAVAAGLVPVTGGIAGVVTGAVTGFTAAGDMAVVGGAPGGRFTGGALGGGGWPNEVSAKVTEQRLAISSVFIGLIGKFSRARIPMSWISSSTR
jgi:hypothetical protein